VGTEYEACAFVQIGAVVRLSYFLISESGSVASRTFLLSSFPAQSAIMLSRSSPTPSKSVMLLVELGSFLEFLSVSTTLTFYPRQKDEILPLFELRIQQRIGQIILLISISGACKEEILLRQKRG
jgi:hypothetical protein